MANVKKLWLFTDTANVKNAGANARSFYLVVEPTEGPRLRLPFGDPPGNNLERNRADIFKFDVNGRGLDSDQLGPTNFIIETDSSDGWLPASIFLLAEISGGRFQLLVARGTWPNKKWIDLNGKPPSDSEQRLDVR
jgi:hypothetical protein